MRYGYCRTSTIQQEQDRQKLILEDYKIEKTFEEKISGRVEASKRPEFEKMLQVLNEGDEIYFESLSRLGRSTVDLIDTVNMLTKKYKVRLVFLKEGLKINPEGNGMDAVSNLFFTIMASLAQFERDLIAQRTREGLKAKKAMGVVLGRPTAFTKQDIEENPKFQEFYNDWQQAKGYDYLMEKYEMSRPTVAKYVKICKNKFYGEE